MRLRLSSTRAATFFALVSATLMIAHQVSGKATRDALRLSLRAVFSAARSVRGTALEYLENVLPDALRRALWPHLGLAVASGQRDRRRNAGADRPKD